MENKKTGNRQDQDPADLKGIIVKCMEWFAYLKSKWLTILLCCVVGALLGFAYAYTRKPIYTASTSFVLEEEKSGGSALGSLTGLASMAGVDLLGGGGGLFQGDNIIELYKSRSMIRKTLLSKAFVNGSEIRIIERYIQYNKLREKWASNPQLKSIDFRDSSRTTLKHDSLMAVIVKDIKDNILEVAKPDRKLSIIDVKIKSKDEVFAKIFSDNLVSNVTDFYIQTKTKKSLFNIGILQKQVDSVMGVMNNSIYSAASTIDATPNLNPSRQALRAPAQRYQFSAETNKAILTELVKNLELAKISRRKEVPLIQVIDSPIYPLERDNFGKLKGIIVGGFLGFILVVMILVIRRSIKQLLIAE
ncbi:Wzz/FepE/Etk N-terminal domain-containing protein [Pedobacter antarcticus]|uniref:Wzz/FepE/Etk N-terminal domain-containing protein n=1 Tax=Pedobacter antarcticus TaxID=34086 RepID=UPI00087EA2C2|nr:Wzz/FepE/Etk N-terminal domain-containing protein [Pedobacter antarcticus]SDM17730.1 Chain length determinant protein [Pedobacter antarcticus]